MLRRGMAERALLWLIHRALADGQCDAHASFTFNLGSRKL